MNNEIVILREAIKKLIPMIAGRGLVVTQIGTQAYVMPNQKTGLPERVNIPNIPDNATPEFVQAIQGFIDHEVAHVLYTDFLFKAGEKSQRLHNLHNIVEDTRIERQMGADFPGSKGNIDRLSRYFIQNVTKKALDDAKTQEEEFFYLFVVLMRALADHVPFQELMDEGDYWNHPLVKSFLDRFPKEAREKMPHLQSTAEAYDIAVICEQIMYPPPPPAPPMPEPEEQDDQVSDDKSDACEDQKDQGQGESDDEKDEGEGSPEEQSDEDAGEPDDKEGKDGEGKGEREHTDETDSEDASGGEEDGEGDEEDRESADSKTGSGSDSGDEEGDDESGASKGEDEEKEGDASDDGESDGDANDEDDTGEQADSDESDPAAEGDEASDDAPEEKSEDEGDDEGASADENGDDEAPGSDDEADGDDADGDQSGSDDDGDAADGDEAGESDDSDDEAEGSQDSLGVESAEDTDTDEVGDEELNRSELQGVGYDGPNPFVNMREDGFKDKDLSSSIAIIIQREAIQAMNAADYTVYTREYDVIRLLDVPEEFKNKAVVQMDEETRSMTGVMQKDIERMMAAQSRVFNVGGQRKGKLNGSGLHRLQVNDPRIFTRREEIRAKDTAVMLLNDCSGSMQGRKCATAMSSSYALSSTLERVNIANEVMGFTTGGFWTTDDILSHERLKELMDLHDAEVKKTGVDFSRVNPIYMPIFKEFGERLNSEVKRRFAFMRTKQPNMGGNIDGESLEYAAIRLMKRKENRKVMIVLSDGFPAGAKGDHEHLKMMTEKLTKAGIDLVGIGIESTAVARFYDNHLVLNSVTELPGAVMGKLRQILMK